MQKSNEIPKHAVVLSKGQTSSWEVRHILINVSDRFGFLKTGVSWGKTRILWNNWETPE